MQDILLDYFLSTARLHVVLITLEVSAIIIAMVIDLIAGVNKAKANGTKRTSRGLKMTAKKAHRYLSPFAVLSMIDLLSAIILPAPFFSMIFAAYVLWCEFVSVREKAWEKAEIDRASRTISMVIENRDDLARAIADLIINNQASSNPSRDEDKSASH